MAIFVDATTKEGPKASAMLELMRRMTARELTLLADEIEAYRNPLSRSTRTKVSVQLLRDVAHLGAIEDGE